MTQSQVITQFIAHWGKYLSSTDRKTTLELIVPKLTSNGSTQVDEPTFRQILLDWHLRTATPEWLNLAGMSKQARELRSLQPFHLKLQTDYSPLYTLLDTLNTTLTDSINRLDAGNPTATTKALRQAAHFAIGASGNQAAIMTATRPYIDLQEARIAQKLEYAAAAATFIKMLTQHAKTPRGANPVQTAAATLAPTVHRLQQSLVDLFHQITSPDHQSTPA